MDNVKNNGQKIQKEFVKVRYYKYALKSRVIKNEIFSQQKKNLE